MKKIALSMLMVSLMVACSSQKPKEETKEEPKQQPPAAIVQQPVAAEVKAAEPVAVVDTLNDPNSILAQRSTFYPFDVSVVQSADRPLVQAHAKYLSEHPNRKVRLEGNCDERGSKKYNMGLGQRRADGVKELLLAGGAMASQIETVSYGKERPRLTCHEEKCWKENRRTDLIYIK
jgi:peptidoglycan-associated lipoprotein